MIKHEINAEASEEYAEYHANIIKATDAVLYFEKIKYACEINIEITDNLNIQKLNKEFRGQDKVTDVLSFPMMERNPENDMMMLGDIVISGERAKEQSEEINQSLERELMFLTVHAVLHLLGYDHELSEEHDSIMRKRQKEIIELLENNINMSENINKKTAFIAIVGRPNTGKSTLLNALLNEKISIISKKPQTTRNKITGILTKDIDDNTRAQYVFFDTPGIHLPKSLLGRYMSKSVKTALGGVDIAILVIEPDARIGASEREVIENLKKTETPVILAINKIDITPKDKILPVIQSYSQEYEFTAVLPISAMQGDGIELVFNELDKYLIASEFFFPEDMITDQPERQIAAELIREKALRLLMDEVPHGIGVAIEEYNEQKSKNLISIRAEIFCERETHKRIIIGKGGEMIKKIGSYAREDLEKFFECKIYLDLWVKVKREWRDKQSILSNLGYNERDL